MFTHTHTHIHYHKILHRSECKIKSKIFCDCNIFIEILRNKMLRILIPGVLTCIRFRCHRLCCRKNNPSRQNRYWIISPGPRTHGFTTQASTFFLELSTMGRFNVFSFIQGKVFPTSGLPFPVPQTITESSMFYKTPYFPKNLSCFYFITNAVLFFLFW